MKIVQNNIRNFTELFKANKGMSYMDSETKFEDSNVKLMSTKDIKASPEFEKN